MDIHSISARYVDCNLEPASALTRMMGLDLCRYVTMYWRQHRRIRSKSYQSYRSGELESRIGCPKDRTRQENVVEETKKRAAGQLEFTRAAIGPGCTGDGHFTWTCVLVRVQNPM